MTMDCQYNRPSFIGRQSTDQESLSTMRTPPLLAFATLDFNLAWLFILTSLT